MSKTVMVFINNFDQLRADAVVSFDQSTVAVTSNGLNQLSIEYDIPINRIQHHREDACYVIIPGTFVREKITHIPAKSQHQVQKALPHALQDEIVGSAKNTIFTIIEHRFGRQRIHLCNRAQIAKCVNDFELANLSIQDIFSDLSFTERLPGEYKIIFLPNLALISLGTDIHYACRHDQLMTLLLLSLSCLPVQPESIHIYSYFGLPDWVGELTKTIRVELISDEIAAWYRICAQAVSSPQKRNLHVWEKWRDLIPWKSSQVPSKQDSLAITQEIENENRQKEPFFSPVGLLPVDLKPKKHPTRVLWLACCALVCVTTMIPVAAHVVEYYYLHNQFKALENQIHATYTKLVPGIHSNFSAHEDVLKQLDRQLQTESGDTFLTSLHIISFALVHHPDLILENASFDEKKLLFTVKTTKDDDADIFTERMKGHGVIHKLALKILGKQDVDDVKEIHYALEPIS